MDKKTGHCPNCAIICGKPVLSLDRGDETLLPYPVGDPMIGLLIGGTYRLERRIGAGDFGIVYEALHERLSTKVAVKLVHACRRNDPLVLIRFAREIATQSRIRSKHVVQVWDQGDDPVAGPYMVAELLRGANLGRLLDQRMGFGIDEMLALFNQAVAVLEVLHRAGLVHRDVKADNIFLAQDDDEPAGFCLKLLDFGLVRLLGEPSGDESGVTGLDPTCVEMLGSRDVMAPELLNHGTTDGRADIFSLGILMYELLTGRMPFHSVARGTNHRNASGGEPLPPSSVPRAAWVPPVLDRLVLRMLTQDARDRPESVTVVRRALEGMAQTLKTAWTNANLDVQCTLDGIPGHPSEAVVSPPTALPPPHRPFVLAVDDDPIARRLMAAKLARTGTDYSICASAREALNWLDRNPFPDAVLLDIVMPLMDGLQLALRLRELCYAGPVVFCTGLDSPEIRKRSASLGNTWLVEKVTAMQTLPAVLRAAGVGRMQTMALKQ